MLEKFVQAALRHRLGNRPFGIVSNNCWGAHIYQSAGLPFQSPFIGLFIAPQDYLELIYDFRSRIASPLRFADESKHDYVNEMRSRQVRPHPIGILGDGLEIQFLHYRSAQDALDKWSRRVSRLPAEDDQLFFKFCDRDGCTVDQLRSFDQSAHVNKVTFVARHQEAIRTGVHIPGGGDFVPDGLSLSRISGKYFDAAQWIATTRGRHSTLKWPRV